MRDRPFFVIFGRKVDSLTAIFVGGDLRAIGKRQIVFRDSHFFATSVTAGNIIQAKYRSCCSIYGHEDLPKNTKRRGILTVKCPICTFGYSERLFFHSIKTILNPAAGLHPNDSLAGRVGVISGI